MGIIDLEYVLDTHIIIRFRGRQTDRHAKGCKQQQSASSFPKLFHFILLAFATPTIDDEEVLCGLKETQLVFAVELGWLST